MQDRCCSSRTPCHEDRLLAWHGGRGGSLDAPTLTLNAASRGSFTTLRQEASRRDLRWLGHGGGGTGGRRGVEARRLRGGPHGSLPGHCLERFVERIIVDSCWAWTGFNSASWSRTSKRRASVSDAGFVAPFSDVIKFVAQFYPGHYFYELLFWQTLALVFAAVHGGYCQNFIRFST